MEKSNVRLRMKILAAIMFISGVFGLVNTAGTVFMPSAVLAVLTAAGIYAVSVIAQPSTLLIRGVIGLAVVRVLASLGATIAVAGTETGAMIAGFVFPALLAAYTVVVLRELRTELSAKA
ncbi:MAG: hypothetical protein HOV71_26605 [Hamadaea sp.]|uniref:hypothetical protein n=1 Tax=Hamadaea sp. NPDC050747 TaxID=3155789 RepID=UPI00184C3308|nr:hypothetical protein [Hamadaea sp.]NUR51711.1 hypothetical protein [Hamadaea sp.]NUT04988.1 hypothetical protein [Hamadaea sp.]